GPTRKGVADETSACRRRRSDKESAGRSDRGDYIARRGSKHEQLRRYLSHAHGFLSAAGGRTNRQEGYERHQNNYAEHNASLKIGHTGHTSARLGTAMGDPLTRRLFALFTAKVAQIGRAHV